MDIKNKIFKICNKFGYNLTKRTFMPPRNSMRDSYLHIKTFGFYPKVVIDVGVASGTYELYDAFPNSFLC